MADSARERALVKLRSPVEIRYKFLSKTRQDPEQEQIFEGSSQAISAQGCLLQGKVPRPDWLGDLLTQKMLLGVNMLLPSYPDPIKALGEVNWIEKMEEESGRCMIGVGFRDIAAEDRNKIFAFQVKAQLPSA